MWWAPIQLCFCALVGLSVAGFVKVPPNNNVLPGGGVGLPLPNTGCVITWDQFKQHVEGRTYMSVYGIDGDNALNPDKGFKFKAQWNDNEDGTINRAGSYWEVASNQCSNFNSDFDRVGNNFATWTPSAPNLGDAFTQPNRRDWLISCDPSEYIIFYICYDMTKVVGNKCPDNEIAIMVPDQRPNVDANNDGIPDGDATFTNIDWCAIEKKSARCFGEKFVNNDALGWEWYWVGPECPFVPA